MNRAEQKLAKLQAQCDRFNAECPVGTEVLVKLDAGKGNVITKTTSAAYVLSGHTPVVFVEGIAGCYLLDRVSKVIVSFERRDGKLIQRKPATLRGNNPVADALRDAARVIRGYDMTTEDAIDYLLQAAKTAIADPLPPSGPPTPDLAAQPDSTPNYETARESMSEYEKLKYDPIWRDQRIGVHDYASFVSCLRAEYRIIFPDAPLTDPQDMIQRMTAEIQVLRRGPGVRNND